MVAAIGLKTSRIEIGTTVIDMRSENPLYLAEDAGAAVLLAGGRLQLGISRGSPEPATDGWRHFGHASGEGENDADMARCRAEVFLDVQDCDRMKACRCCGGCRPAMWCSGMCPRRTGQAICETTTE